MVKGIVKLSFLAERKAPIDFSKAAWQMLWRKLRPEPASICNDLVATADLWPNVEGYQINEAGLQDIPMDRIVGSSKAHDFDLGFQLRRGQDDSRFTAVTSLIMKGKKLPPPMVLKVQNSYFVVDGNHRISAARRMGWSHIQAWVTELVGEKLIEEPNCSRLGFRLEPTAAGREKSGCSRLEAGASRSGQP